MCSYSDDDCCEDEASYDLMGIVDSQRKVVNLNLNLNWKSHFSGVNGTSFNDSNGTTIIKEHTFLIVWPKQDSFNLYCRFGLGSLIEQIETSLEQVGDDNNYASWYLY